MNFDEFHFGVAIRRVAMLSLQHKLLSLNAVRYVLVAVVVVALFLVIIIVHFFYCYADFAHYNCELSCLHCAFPALGAPSCLQRVFHLRVKWR